MIRLLKTLRGAAMIAAALVPACALAQATPPLSTCTGRADVPACTAVPGDRAEGYRGQSRAGLLGGENDHQVGQQSRRGNQQRSEDARTSR